MRRGVLGLVTLGALLWSSFLLGLCLYYGQGGRLYSNAGSISLPGGYYACHPLPGGAVLEPGTLVLFEAPPALRAQVRQYLGPHAVDVPWMKHVRGRSGQTVCLEDETVTVDGLVVATRPLLRDYALPAVQGCWVLASTEVFVLGTHPRSYDSRYFGSLRRDAIQATCTTLWLWETTP